MTASVLLLQQLLAWFDNTLPLRQEQAGRSEALDLAPAALFYTELPVVLAAEKQLRERLAQMQQQASAAP